MLKNKITKRIVSLLIVFVIIINLLPNFSLLFGVYATTDIEKGVILKKGNYDAENKVFSIELSLKNLDATAIDITFCYPSDIVETINYIKYEAGVVEASTTQARTMEEPLEEFYIDTGAINDANISIFFNGECYAAGTDITILKMYFHITDDSVSINDITNEMFKIWDTSDDPDAYFAIVTDDSPEGEYSNEFNMYQVKGFIDPASREVTGISITTPPKTDYTLGELLDLAGMEVTATYNNDSTNTKILTTDEYETNADALDLKTAGEKTLTVTYVGKDNVAEGTTLTATVTLNVREKNIVSLEIQGIDGSYKQDDTIDLSKITVVATDEKGDSRTLNADEYTLSSTGNNIVGNKIKLTNSGTTTITATYKGENVENPANKPSATKTITVTEKVLTGIEITPATKDVYTVGETLDLSGLTVTPIYDDVKDENPIETGYTTKINGTTVQTGTPLSNIGVQTITVDYNGKTDTFDVVVFPTKLVGTEGDALSTVAVEGFTWADDTQEIAVGENEYTLTFTNTDPEKTKTCGVKVLGLPTGLTATYGDTLADVTLPEEKGFSWADTTTSVGNATEDGNEFAINYIDTDYADLKVKIIVDPKEIIVKIENTSSEYTGEEPTLSEDALISVEPTDLVNGDTVASLKIKLRKDPGTNVGDYDITGEYTSTNYDVTFKNKDDNTKETGTYTITKGTLVADNFDKTIPSSKEYDGSPVTAASANIKSSIIGAGTTIVIKYYKDGETTGSTVAPSDYGTYTVKANVAEGTNYFAADGTDGKPEIELGSFSITKKQLTKFDIDFEAPNPNTYDGTKKEATVAIKSSITGAGTISAIKYYKNGVEADPIDAGDYTVKITTTGATNYENVTDLEVGTFTIEKAEPTVTAPIGLTATYGDELSSVTLPEGFTWEESGKVGDAGTRTHTVKYTSTDSNYKDKTGISVTVEVAKADLEDSDFELTGMPTNNTKEYDGDSVTVTSKIKDGVLGADDIRNKVTVTYYKKEDGTETDEAPSDYGTYEVRVSVVEGNNYNAVNGLKIGEFSITSATLDIAEIKVKNPNPNVYDGTPKLPTIEMPVGAGTVKDIKYYKDGTTTEVSNPTDAGIYRVKITTENATNYANIETLTDVGAFEIVKADIPVGNINIIPSTPKTYDGTESTATATIDTTVVPGATDVTIDVTYEDAEGNEVQNPTDAGVYTIKVSSTGGANYKSLAETETIEKIVINKVTLSKDDIKCTLPESLVYDNTSKKATITVEKDLGEGRTLTVASSDITIKYEDAEGNIVADPKNAGAYTIKVKVNAGKNYEALAETEVTTYTVEKATLTVADFTISGIPDGGSKPYDGTAVAVTASQKSHIIEELETEVQYYNSKTPDNAELSAPSGVGTYIVKLKVKEANNYKEANIELGQFAITPKGFDANKIKYTNTAEYDGTNKDANAVNIYIEGDTAATITDVKFYKAGHEANARDVGIYTVYADITTTESGHVGVIEIGTFTITPKAIEVTIQDETIEYGQELTAIQVNDDIVLGNGDNIEDIITYELSAKTAGTQTIIGKVKNTDTAKNYTVTFNNGTCTITPKPITVTIGNTSSIYSGVEPTLPATSTLVTIPDGAIVGTDDLGITLTKDAGTDAGDYAITGNATNANYDVSFENGTYTITKATLDEGDFDRTISDVTFGTTVNVVPTYKNGITEADAGTISVKYYKEDGTPVTTPTEVGKYIVKANTPGGTNYFAADGVSADEEGNILEEITLGKFSITKSDEPFTLTGVTFNDKTVTYNGAEQTITVTGSLPEGVKVTYTNNKGTDAGTYNAIATFTIDETSELYTQYGSIKVEGTQGNTLTATLTIDKKDPKDEPDTYGEDLSKLTNYEKPYKTVLSDITLPTGSMGTFEWKTPDAEVGNVGTRTHKVIYTPRNTNYKPVELDVDITVTKIDPEYNLGELEATYGDTLADVTLPEGFTWNDLTTTSVGNAGQNTFKVTFTPEDTDNYNILTNIDAIVNVEKADPTTDPTFKAPTGLEGYEGQPLSSIDIEAFTGFSWTDSTTLLPLISDNGNTFNTTMTFTPADTDNYKTIENISVQVNVKENEIIGLRVTSTKADGANPEYFEGQTFNRNDILVEAEWAIGGWQTVTDYTITDEARTLTTSDTLMEINYAGKTADQAIKVKEDEVASITITAPDKLTYNYGDSMIVAGGSITKVWASGKTEENIPMTLDMLSIKDNTTFNFNSMNEVGAKEVTVEAFGKTIENAFQITVNDKITGIQVKNKENLQKIYHFGKSLNYNYMNTEDPVKVTVTYGSKAPEEIDLRDCELTGYDLSDKTKIGQPQTVTVTYEGQTDTFEVILNDYVEDIKVTKYKAIYDIGETLSIQEVIAKMASGEENLVVGYTTSGFDSTTPGSKTVTVSYDGKTAQITVTVRNKVNDMYIEKLPSQISSDGTNVDKTIPWGTDLSKTGGSIIVKDAENPAGKEIPMTNSAVTLEGYNPTKLGTQIITVRYTYNEITDDGEVVQQSKTDTFTVTVEDYETNTIKITSPTKTTYNYGENLDLTGGTVSKVWASGKITDTTPIDSGMVSGYNAVKVGTQTLTITHWGKTANFNVTVVDKTLGISMKKNPNKTEYTQGQAIDVTGAVLNVTKQSGIKEVPITKDMISGYNPNKVGTQVITVTYDGKQTQFVVNVKAKPTTKPTNPTRPVNPTKPSTSEVVKYTVTFVNYDGTVLKEEVVESGKSATAPELEKRDGYKFKGWDKLFNDVKEDITVKAQYEEIDRAKIKGSVTVEKGKDPDLSDVTLEIFDEDGEKIDEIPVTEDMISGFDPEKIGTQVVTVTYVGEDGYEYTDTLKIRVVRPTETLGVKDEFVETKAENMPFLPVIAGTSGAIGLLLILLALASRKNVEIYALTENKRKLVGKQKISKNNPRIVLDEYERQLKNANIEIVLNKNITKKLDDEVVSVVFDGKRSTYKVEYVNKEEFIIRIKNVD